MLVFRICSQKEIEYILCNHCFDSIGQIGKFTEANSHNYICGTNYLHFFKQKSDILYIASGKGNCVCTYDIPREILDLYCGVGKYMDFINFKERSYVIEFAIPVFVMQFDYLKKVDVLLDYIDYEDFLCGDIDYNKYETIYDSSKFILRERKKEGNPS